MSYGEIGNLTILAMKRSSTQPTASHPKIHHFIQYIRTTHTHYYINYKYSRIIQRNNNLFWFDGFFFPLFFLSFFQQKYAVVVSSALSALIGDIFIGNIFFCAEMCSMQKVPFILYILGKTMITILCFLFFSLFSWLFAFVHTH